MSTVKNVKSMSLADIYKLIDDKKIEKAFPFLLDIKGVADRGDAVAQYYLGVLLFSNKEDAEGERYLKLSVEGNYLPAIRTCLQKYLPATRTRINVSEKERQSLLLKLIKSGNVNAMCAYAWLKLEDALSGVECLNRFDGDPLHDVVEREKKFNKCSREAFTILYKAAAKGNTLALFMLSMIYDAGLFIDIECKYTMAADGIFYREPHRLSFWSKQVPSDKKHARELLVRGANAGDVLCLYWLIKHGGYSDAEELRLLKIARDKYNNLEWSEIASLFPLGDFPRLERGAVSDAGIVKKGEFSYFTYNVAKYCNERRKTDSVLPRNSLLIDNLHCFGCYDDTDYWPYIAGVTDELPRKLKELKPSALMPSGVTGVVDTTPLPDFLTADYKRFAEEIEKEKAKRAKEERESSPEYQKEQRERAEREEARQAAEKAAKERKDAIQGCGCLLAIAAAIGFFVWWWWEGMTMSALPGMWKQTKGVLGESGWGIAGKVAGAIVVLVIGWGLIRGITGKKGEMSTSPKKRWKFVVLGILLGAFGVHLAYAKRWFLFLLLWTGFITGNVMTPTKPNSGENPAEATAQQVEPADKAGKDGGSPISGVGFGVWALLWIGGTLFIKKDGKGNRM